MSLLPSTQSPAFLNGALLCLGACIVWAAGTRLPLAVDALSERKDWGKNFMGLLFLGGTTSLPEIASSVTAARLDNAQLAAGNLLGGVPLLFAILGFVDLAYSTRPLTKSITNPTLLLGAVWLIASLALCALGVTLGGLGPRPLQSAWPAMLFVLYLVSLASINGDRPSALWKNQRANEARLDESATDPAEEQFESTTTVRLWMSFAVCAAAILVAGMIVARAGDALARQFELNGSFLGATLLAVTTSLPELSSSRKAVQIGTPGLAVSGILGACILQVGLLFTAEVALADGTVFSRLGPSEIYLCALGIILTCTLMWGLLEQRDATLFRAGVDSILILFIYSAGLLGLYFIS